MKVLQNHQFTKATGGGRKHDWDTILDGQVRQLDQEDMGDAKQSTFGTQIRGQAKKRGLTVRIQKLEDGGLIVQAFNPEANGSADKPTAVATAKKKK